METEFNRNESGEISDALENDRIEEKLSEPGKAYSDIDDYDGEAVYRKDSGEDSLNDNMATSQEGSLDSDVQDPLEAKQALTHTASEENNEEKKKQFEVCMDYYTLYFYINISKNKNIKAVLKLIYQI